MNKIVVVVVVVVVVEVFKKRTMLPQVLIESMQLS